MKFTKMQGAGNDFIIINNIAEHIPAEELSRLAKRLCTRRLSVGADGLMAVTEAKNGGDFAMLFFNSDGSLGEMCGNGARCICRYGYENALAGEEQHVETTAGPVAGRRIDRRMYRVRLNAPTVMRTGLTLTVDGRKYEANYVELGRPGLPHCVVRLDDYDAMPEEELRALGRALRYYPDFPKGANVTFVKVISPSELKAVTYERGVEDFTLACGTGCGSAVSSLALTGAAGSENMKVSMPGGELFISADVSGGAARDIFLTGPTNIVCLGEITDEDM